MSGILDFPGSTKPNPVYGGTPRPWRARCGSENGQDLDLDPAEARRKISQCTPEAILKHWVEIDGTRWPPKQALEVASGVHRSIYTSHEALRHLRALGFLTSEWRAGHRSPARPKRLAEPAPSVAEIEARLANVSDAFKTLVSFLASQAFTPRVAELESQLVGADAATCSSIAEQAGFASTDLLAAALLVRAHAGRLNDVIHASVIAQVLPLMLEEGERVTVKPSLAAGNDQSRLFDLETDRRVAEFKVAAWKGKDAMRKRTVFADLASVFH